MRFLLHPKFTILNILILICLDIFFLKVQFLLLLILILWTLDNINRILLFSKIFFYLSWFLLIFLTGNRQGFLSVWQWPTVSRLWSLLWLILNLLDELLFIFLYFLFVFWFFILLFWGLLFLNFFIRFHLLLFEIFLF